MEEQRREPLFRRFRRTLDTQIRYTNGKLKNLINQDWNITPTRRFNLNL